MGSDGASGVFDAVVVDGDSALAGVISELPVHQYVSWRQWPGKFENLQWSIFIVGEKR